MYNFGLWNLIASVIVAISFISGPLTISTQRFFSFDIGKGNLIGLSKVFSQSIWLTFALTLISIVLLEVIGLWLINNKLSIPANQHHIAIIIFQFSIISLFLSLLRMPYNAIIVAFEKMDFYAYISVLEAILKLGIVYLLLIITTIDKLILYAILTLLVTLIITCIYIIYVRIKFNYLRIKFEIHKQIIKELSSFSFWSIFGSFAVMTSNQGVAFVLNTFFGVIINATYGISQQVASAVTQFVSNFQTAFNPQIVKIYAQNDEVLFIDLIMKCCRISYILMLEISIPLMINMQPILKLWLGQLPPDIQIFCELTLIYLLIDTISASLNIGIYASGKIRSYQIGVSIILLLTLPLSYLALKIGCQPFMVITIRCFISVISLLFRIITLDNLLTRSIKWQIFRLLPKLFIISVMSLCLPLIFYYYCPTLWVANIIICLLSTTMVAFLFGLSKDERKNIYKLLSK